MAEQTSTTASAPATNAPPSPARIMELASGFMAAKHLFAANDLGLFEALAESPATIGALAARTGLTVRAARISADAMVALGFLTRSGDLYSNAELAATFLSGRGPADLRPFLRFWDRVSYPAWANLSEALAKGPAHEYFELDDDLQRVISEGIEAILTGPSHALPRVVDFSGRRRLLDIGGGTGSWAIVLARAFPTLQATVFERPVVAEVARERVAGMGLSSRIAIAAGDAMAGDLPAGHDTFLVANLVHYWSPEENRVFLRRIRDVAEPGALLLLTDFWTDPTHTQPLQAALMAGEFAVHLRHGDVYSVDECREWLATTGWRFLDHRVLAGPQSVVIADAV